MEDLEIYPQNNHIGCSWEELRKELFTEKEIEIQDRKINELYTLIKKCESFDKIPRKLKKKMKTL